jgi:hypothetical protein
MPKRKSNYYILNAPTRRLRHVSNELVSPPRNGPVSKIQKAKLLKLVTRPTGALEVLGWKSESTALAFAREVASRYSIFQVRDKSGMRCYARK